MEVSGRGIKTNRPSDRGRLPRCSRDLPYTEGVAQEPPLQTLKPAAEPRIRLLTIFMLTSKYVLCIATCKSGLDCRRKNVEDQRIFKPVDFSKPPETRRFEEPPSVGRKLCMC